MIGLGQGVAFFGLVLHWDVLADAYSCFKYLLIASFVLAYALTKKPHRGHLTIIGLLYMVELVAISIIAWEPICFIGKKLNYFTGVFPSFLVFACYHYSVGDKWEKIADALIAACVLASLCSIGQQYGFFLPQGDYFGGRAYAMIGSPVFLSGSLAMAIPLCLGRGRVALAIPLLFTAIMLTQSRSGVLASAVGILGYFYAKSVIGARGVLVLSAIALAITVGMFSGSRNTKASDSGRYQMMRVAAKSIMDHPFGVGPERFGWVIKNYRDAEFDNATTTRWTNAYAHNHLIEAMLSGGIVFFLVHLAVIGVVGLFLLRFGSPQVFGSALALCVFGLMQPTPLLMKCTLACLLGALEPFPKPIPKAPFIILALCAFAAALSTVTTAKIYKTGLDLGIGQVLIDAYKYQPSARANE